MVATTECPYCGAENEHDFFSDSGSEQIECDHCDKKYMSEIEEIKTHSFQAPCLNDEPENHKHIGQGRRLVADGVHIRRVCMDCKKVLFEGVEPTA